MLGFWNRTTLSTFNSIHFPFCHRISLFKNSLFKTTLDDMIVVKNIEFSSTCEHEITPFFGMVNLGYIPNGNIIGLSKIPKIIKIPFHFMLKFVSRRRSKEKILNS